MGMINLFPWRQQQIIYKRKMMQLTLSITIVFNIILYAGAHAVLLRQFKSVQMANIHLQQKLEINQQNQIALESSYVANTLIQNILASQHTMELFFRKLDSDMQNVCFTAISKLNHIVSFSGVAPSTFDLMNFLHDWPMAKLFSEIQIEQLRQEGTSMHFQFRALEDENVQQNN